MEPISKIINSIEGKSQRVREIHDEKTKDKTRYSTIFHSITRELNLDTSLKIAIFANVEGLSRGKNCCVMNPEELAFNSGCSEKELRETLDEFKANKFIERGEDPLRRKGWRLTEDIRAMVEPIRAELNRKRARKYGSSKA